MFGNVAAIPADSRVYREWFEFVGRTLAEASSPLSVRDLATTFCERGLPLDGTATTLSDVERLAGALVPQLAAFEACSLVTGQTEARFTQSLRLSVPEKVAKLTDKGTRYLSAPHWQTEFLFQRLMVWQLLRRAWKPFAGVVAVASTVAGVLKLFLFWRSEQAAIAGLVAGGATVIGVILSGRR
jgi:hypothetical protein